MKLKPLSKFKLYYQEVPFRHSPKLYDPIYVALWEFIKKLYSKGFDSYKPVVTTSRRRVKTAFAGLRGWYRARTPKFLEIRCGSFSIKLSWVAIAILSGFGWLIWPHAEKTIAAPRPRQVIISQTPIKPVSSPEVEKADEIPVAPPPAPKPAVVAAPVITPVSYDGSHEDWMAAAGISPADYNYVDYIVYHESTWSYTAVNYLGATGLCQSLPGNKMATAGADYLTNPVTQLIWCNSYAQGFGGWAGAYYYWLAHHYW